MEETSPPHEKADRGFLLLSLFLTIALWLCFHISEGVNTNISWMMTAAARLLSGETMTSGYYDVNPPLSFLIYVPPAFLAHLLHLAPNDADFIYTLLLTTLSAAASWKLLVSLKLEPDIRMAFVASYLIAATLLPGHYFGEREHLVILGLVPFCLAQLGIMARAKLSWRLAGPVFVLGGLVMLMKPQYLLAPGLLALHRIAARKDPRAILSPDVLILAAVIFLSGGVVVFFFRDYVTAILPDMLTLYASSLRNRSLMPITFALGAIVVAFILLAVRIAPRARWFILMMYIGSLLGLFSLALQGKFFYYHLIPALMCFQCGTALLLAGRLQGREALAAAFCFSLVFGIAGNRDWLSPWIYPSHYAAADGGKKIYHWPSHEDYRRSELVGLVKKYAPGGSYFVFGSMPIANIPAAYTDSTFGSRFPCLWFLPPLIEADEKLKAGQPAKLTAGQLEAYKKKYNAMVAADFERYKPSLVLVARIYMTEAEKEPFDLVRWLSADAKFVQTWKHYRKIKTISLDSRDYYGGYDYGSASEIATYDVYIADKILVPH